LHERRMGGKILYELISFDDFKDRPFVYFG
jgi:hypothetical protein